MNTQKFEGINQNQVDGLIGQLGANCTASEPSENGEVTYTILDNGFHATAVWDEKAGTLNVEVLGKPWFVPMGVIWSKLEADLKEEKEKEN